MQQCRLRYTRKTDVKCERHNTQSHIVLLLTTQINNEKHCSASFFTCNTNREIRGKQDKFKRNKCVQQFTTSKNN